MALSRFQKVIARLGLRPGTAVQNTFTDKDLVDQSFKNAFLEVEMLGRDPVDCIVFATLKPEPGKEAGEVVLDRFTLDGVQERYKKESFEKVLEAIEAKDWVARYLDSPWDPFTGVKRSDFIKGVQNEARAEGMKAGHDLCLVGAKAVIKMLFDHLPDGGALDNLKHAWDELDDGEQETIKGVRRAAREWLKEQERGG